VLRAVFVLVADRRVLADAFVAVAILAAVPVVAALGADASLRIPVLAADEPVATVDLVAAIATGAGNLETAVVAEVLAALIVGHAFVSTAAGVSKETQQRMAGAVVTADFAVWAIGIAAAHRIGALTDFITNRATEAVVIGAALGAMRAICSLTAAILSIRASRNVGADMLFALDARAEIRRNSDAIVIGAALAALVPGAIAADTAGIEIDAEADFTFLAASAAVNALSTDAVFAKVACADALTAFGRCIGKISGISGDSAGIFFIQKCGIAVSRDPE
jgi:hypothetical protein